HYLFTISYVSFTVSAPAAIYPLSLHDALPIYTFELRPFAEGWWIDSTFARLVAGPGTALFNAAAWFDRTVIDGAVNGVAASVRRSEEHTSELQSRENLVCRLLLEKKKQKYHNT